MRFGFLLFTLAFTACQSHKAPLAPVPPTPPALKEIAKPVGYEIPNTQVFTLDSADTGNSYNMVISLPGDYSPDDKTKTYPVIYVLDAQWQFPLIYTMSGAVNYDGDMPSPILVGISWKETNGNLMALRNVDLTPSTIASEPTSGHAKNFQAFFRNQLFPYMESHYKVNQHRTVTGGSTSSLFVFYTLISQPDLFDGYIGSSPSVWWDKKIINRLLDEAPTDLIHQKTRAYMSWGSLEREPEVIDFAKRLQNKHIKNLEFRAVPVENAGHAGVNAECYTRGFQYVYAKPDLNLSAATLKALAGTYHNAKNNYSVTVSIEKGKLAIAYPEEEKMLLNAESDARFYVRGNGLEYQFEFNDQHRVTGLTQSVHGSTSLFTRM